MKVELSNLFSSLIVKSISSDDLVLINDINAKNSPDSFCATHDYCDAWGVMFSAVKKFIPNINVDQVYDEEMELITATWDLSRANQFKIQPIEQ